MAMVASLAICAPTAIQAAQDNLESVMWELVSLSEDPEKIETFIENFPDSEHVDEARAMLTRIETRKNSYGLEDSIFQSVGNVTYTAPMAFGNEHLIGQSLSEIVEASPQYPPVEGLPEEMWQERSCSTCHNWTRETLCTQASTYVSMDPAKYREKMHPFGGLLKINLRNWAQNDCG